MVYWVERVGHHKSLLLCLIVRFVFAVSTLHDSPTWTPRTRMLFARDSSDWRELLHRREWKMDVMRLKPNTPSGLTRNVLRGGQDPQRGETNENDVYEGELEVEEASQGELDVEEACQEGSMAERGDSENITSLMIPEYELTDSSDQDKTDEDGMPFNTNFTLRNASVGNHDKTERGCRHYSRGCRLLAPCCNRLFWCRHCHNEEMDVNCRDPKKAHQLDRFAIQHVQCAACSLTQPVQHNCTQCGHNFGKYFCSVCVFFDDDVSKGHFHCDGCGICRIGGRDNFFHCANCGCCYAMQLRDNHRCIAGAMHHNCPVCLEDLFHSTSQARVLRCGHTMHKKCLEQLLTRSVAIHVCPLCQRTLVDHSATWNQLDLAVRCTPLPAELANKTAEILCNECQTKGTVPFHVYGLKCPNPACGGYNTREIQVREVDSFEARDNVREEEAGDSEELSDDGAQEEGGSGIEPQDKG